ncbi:DUF86 domain-containing protein [Candidatus Poribacteria bacterium]|nr:DUF86 domain-containing protein [Candidatus Poribacteria bacterium]
MVAKLSGVHIDVKGKLPFIEKIAETFDNLLALWLFGSYAKGNQTPLSDIDIAYLPVDGLESSCVEELDKKLYNRLSRLFETDDISLVNLRDTPLNLIFSALKEGKVLFCRAPEEVSNFKEHIMNLYPETKKIRRMALLNFESQMKETGMSLDKEKIIEQLRMIKSDIEKLREKRALSEDEYLMDEDTQTVVERKFQTAIESCVNIGNHLISTMNLELASDYASVFRSLRTANLISSDLAEKMADMARFRNLLVHLYWRIDHEKIYEGMEARIETLEKFTREILNVLEETRRVKNS